MCKNNIYIFVIICAISIRLAYAGDGACGLFRCKSEHLFTALSSFGLPPEITKNDELIDGIRIEYGQGLIEELIKEHPSLGRNTGGKIDHKTLKWVQKIGFDNKHSSGVKYIFSPFITKDGNYGADIFIKTMIPQVYPKLMSVPGFFNKEQLLAIETRFAENDFELPKSSLQSYFLINEVKALKIAKKLYKEIFKEKKYISEEELKNIENHNITIVGHGFSGKDYISSDGVQLSLSEVVKIIKNSGIPGRVNIELKHNYAGLGSVEDKIDKTIDELKDMLIQGKINEVVLNKENSYAYKFAKEIFSQWPQFSGNITAYNGFVVPNQVLAYMINPKDQGSLITNVMYSVGLVAKDRKKVHFNKSELRVKYIKEDV